MSTATTQRLAHLLAGVRPRLRCAALGDVALDTLDRQGFALALKEERSGFSKGGDAMCEEEEEEERGANVPGAGSVLGDAGIWFFGLIRSPYTLYTSGTSSSVCEPACGVPATVTHGIQFSIGMTQQLILSRTRSLCCALMVHGAPATRLRLLVLHRAPARWVFTR